MKTLKLKIALILLFSFGFSYAQMGGMNNGMGRGMGTGMGRGGMNQSNMGSDRHVEPTVESPDEIAEKIVTKLKKDLTLDELQVIAIKNILKDSQKSQGVIMKKETDESRKELDIKALNETTDRKIMEMLNKDQKTPYKAVVEERKNKMSSRNGR